MKDARSIPDRVKELIALQALREDKEVTPDASLRDDLDMDSLDLVELAMGIEEEFLDSDPILDEEAEKWKTVEDVISFVERGPLLIHASKAYPGWAKECGKGEPFYSALRPGGIYAYPELSCGNIIGRCIVKDCISTESVIELGRDEREFGDFSANRYAWILEDGQFLPQPIPAKGSLGLWEFNAIPETEADLWRTGTNAVQKRCS